MEFGVGWLKQSANHIRDFILFIAMGFSVNFCQTSDSVLLLVTGKSLRVPWPTLITDSGRNFKERFSLRVLESISSVFCYMAKRS